MLNVELEKRVTNGLSVSDARELQKRLKAIDPMLRTQLLRDVKQIGKPLNQAIQSSLASFTPLSGMRGNGAMGFNSKVPFNKTTLSFRTRSSRMSSTTSLVSIRTKSPLAAVADMAGKSGRFIDKGSRQAPGFSRSYQRNGKTIRHRLNGQGTSMIRNLGKQPSRLVWPSAEKALPAVTNAINQVLINAYRVVNRSF
jgi:hypothetical protein